MQPEENKEVSIRAKQPPQNQLMQLAEAFAPEGMPGLLSTAIQTGRVDVMIAGTALANNTLLDSILGETAAYRHSIGGVSPSSDFSCLSTGSAEEAGAALRRLSAGFLEARSKLANLLVQEDQSVQESFLAVNQGYILLLSTVHQLFDHDNPQYKVEMRPAFHQLLKLDPFLGKLEPSFGAFHGAHSDAAKQVALKKFFETFCEQAEEPTLYDERFSALVRSILLRELRHVVTDESALPITERKLAPYLARQFEKRMRGELQTAQTNDGKPQPVLASLRCCPGEAKLLMQAMTNFILESSTGDRTQLTLDPQDVISCEVMLSVGCLLPETELTELLGTTLHQVDDLNPSITLVFASALKFSLYAGQEDGQINPEALIERTIGIALALTDDERERLLGEVFHPLADDFIGVATKNIEEWSEMPDAFRAECIDTVVIQKILELQNQKEDLTEAQLVLSQQISLLLISHLERSSGDTTPLDPAAYRWLLIEGAEERLSAEQATKIVSLTLSEGDEASRFGVQPEVYSRVLTQGGFETLGVLAAHVGNEKRLSQQLCAYQPKDTAEQTEMREIFDVYLVEPLRRALAEYAQFMIQKQESESESIHAAEKLQNLSRTKEELAELEKQLPILTQALEDEVEFLEIEQTYRENQESIAKKQAKLESLKGLSKKELFASEDQNVPASLQRSIASLERDAEAICDTKIQVPQTVFESLPDYTRKTITLGRLHQMQETRKRFRALVQAGEGASQKAHDSIQTSTDEMAIRRSEIKKLFSYVQHAARADAIRELDPERLRLTAHDSFDLLGIFCRISLAVQMSEARPVAEGRKARAELEQDAIKALEQGFKAKGAKPDATLVLRELATLVQRKAPFLLEWRAGDRSLSEFLFKRLMDDIEDSAIAWLNHDVSWDESMHAPIIDIFSSMLISERIPAENKTRAMLGAYRGVKHWVAQENNTRKIEEENRALPAGEQRTVPERYVTTKDLIRPWTSFLQTSFGVTKGLDASIIEITEHLMEYALTRIEGAEREEMKELYVPLYKALRSCGKREASALHPLPNEVVTLLEKVKTRANELDEAVRNKAAQIAEAAPEAPTPEGIDFSQMRGSGQLALPDRSQFHDGNDQRRLN